MGLSWKHHKQVWDGTISEHMSLNGWKVPFSAKCAEHVLQKDHTISGNMGALAFLLAGHVNDVHEELQHLCLEALLLLM